MAVAITVTPIAMNGLASTAPVGLPVASIIQVRAANAGEISGFSTAVSAVEIRGIQYQQQQRTTYLSTTPVATIITAMNA